MSDGKYRKKPVVIDACQWDGTAQNATTLIDWMLNSGATARYYDSIEGGAAGTWTEPRIAIDTLEGTMSAEPNDWIICGVQGEFYPCKPVIFEATYERIEAQS